MKCKVKFLIMGIASVLCLFASLPVENWGMARLEEALGLLTPDDCIDMSSYVPPRKRDALKTFDWFIKGSGWSTNRFVEVLFYEMTNGVDRGWNTLDEGAQARVIAAASILKEINLPAVTNFFRQCNENPTMWSRRTTVCGMLIYTNLEQDILDYMTSLSRSMSAYDDLASSIYYEMLRTLEDMDDALKPAATNRLAKYAYGTLRQLIDFQAAQDTELVKLVPAYSNSVQRLAAMRFIAGTATNAYMRAKATRLVQELSAVPVDELNNLTWLVEE